MTDVLCPTCEAGPTKRYCAPARCYCGHEDCHAFASWVDMTKVPLPATPKRATKTKAAEAWADREEESWLEKQ